MIAIITIITVDISRCVGTWYGFKIIVMMIIVIISIIIARSVGTYLLSSHFLETCRSGGHLFKIYFNIIIIVMIIIIKICGPVIKIIIYTNIVEPS